MHIARAYCVEEGRAVDIYQARALFFAQDEPRADSNSFALMTAVVLRGRRRSQVSTTTSLWSTATASSRSRTSA